MKRLVEVPLASGGSILVETEITQPTIEASTGDVIKAAETVESALSAIKPVIAGIVGNMMDGDKKPTEITLALGLGLSFGSDGILKLLVATEGNASFNVSITWKPGQGNP